MKVNQTWFCRELGKDGWVSVSVFTSQPCGTMIVVSRNIHPFLVDEHPETFAETIGEMSEVMGRVSALPLPASRARAFGGAA